MGAQHSVWPYPSTICNQEQKSQGLERQFQGPKELDPFGFKTVFVAGEMP
jgi:hypothetical protein